MDLSSLKKNISSVADKTKKGLGESISKMNDAYKEMKEKDAERKEKVNEAKAPIDGSIIRYQVIYLGGFPQKPQKKSDSLSLGFNIMNDRFIFKPEYLAKTQWFGDENLEIPYEQVTKFEVVKRQVSSAEAMLSSNGDTKSLEQLNNIEITYTDDQGIEHLLRVEMLTGVSVYGQAAKCREMLDLLREKQILGKLNKSTADTDSNAPDVLQQIEKLSKLKEAGILSEDEFNQKKADLLAKL